MKRGDWAQQVIRLGEKQSVVRAAVLEGTGMRRSTIYRRCLPGGPWRRLLPGIIQLHSGDPTDRQRLAAALLRGGPNAMISGLWAACLHGMKRLPPLGDIHVLVPASREVTSAGFVLIERTTRLPEPVLRDDTPLAPLDRAVLDGARRQRNYDAIRAMLFESVQRGRCRPLDLLSELNAGSQRGSALPRRALTEVSAGAHSVPEGDAIWIWRRAGLPEPERNIALYDTDRCYIGSPDAWLDDVGLAWEADSVEFHFEVADYARTISRNNRYAAAGIVVVQTVPSQLRREPETVIRELRAAYDAARSRPRPPVHRAPRAA